MIPVLAIDASLRATGWATVTTNDRIDTHHHGLIQPRTRNGTRWRHLKGPERLAWIAANIRHLAHQHGSHAVAIEGYAYSRHSRATTALAELGGVIRTTLWGAGIPHLDIPATSIKQWATGHGNADKHTMIAAAQDLTSWRGTDDNIADAILLHAMVADALGQPYATPQHDRRHAALAPLVTALNNHDLTRPPTVKDRP